jgi:hypothetical protein
VDGSELGVMVAWRGGQRVVGQGSRSAVEGSERRRVVLGVVLSVVRGVLRRVEVVHGRVVVAVGRVVRRRRVHGAWRSPAGRAVRHGAMGVLRSLRVVGSADAGRMMGSVCEGRAGHGPSGDGGDGVLFVDGRLGVHALLGADVTQLRVAGRLLQVLRDGRRAGEVADEMQVLAVGGGDAERLLDQTVGLVAVAVWAFIRGIVVFGSRRFGSGAEGAAAALALHLAVCEEAARHATRAP